MGTERTERLNGLIDEKRIVRTRRKSLGDNTRGIAQSNIEKSNELENTKP